MTMGGQGRHTEMKTHICNTCAVLALLGSVTATTALAADQEICLRYPVETVDSGLGETSKIITP